VSDPLLMISQVLSKHERLVTDVTLVSWFSQVNCFVVEADHKLLRVSLATARELTDQRIPFDDRGLLRLLGVVRMSLFMFVPFGIPVELLPTHLTLVESFSPMILIHVPLEGKLLCILLPASWF